MLSRVVGKAEAAQFFDVSLPTVDAWIRRGCPVEERGGRGRAWRLDLLKVAEWRHTKDVPIANVDPETMNPGDRRLWYESEVRRRTLQKMDGELLEREEVLHVFATTIALITDHLRALPDNLERRVGLRPDALAVVEATIDTELENLKRALTRAVEGGADDRIS